MPLQGTSQHLNFHQQEESTGQMHKLRLEHWPPAREEPRTLLTMCRELKTGDATLLTPTLCPRGG